MSKKNKKIYDFEFGGHPNILYLNPKARLENIEESQVDNEEEEEQEVEVKGPSNLEKLGDYLSRNKRNFKTGSKVLAGGGVLSLLVWLPVELSQTKDVISNLKQELKKLETKEEKDKKELEKNINNVNSRLQKEIENIYKMLSSRVNDLESEVRNLDEENDRLSKGIFDNNKGVKTMELKIKIINDQIDELNKYYEQILQQRSQEILDWISSRIDEVLKLEHERDIKTREDLDKKLSNLENLKTQLQKLQKDFENSQKWWWQRRKRDLEEIVLPSNIVDQSLATELKNLKSKIDNISTQITLKLFPLDLQTRLNEIDNKINALEKEIKKVENLTRSQFALYSSTLQSQLKEWASKISIALKQPSRDIPSNIGELEINGGLWSGLGNLSGGFGG